MNPDFANSQNVIRHLRSDIGKRRIHMGVTDKADIFTIAKYGNYDAFLHKFKDSYINECEDGSSLLHLSIAGRNYEIASFLIQKGINTNRVNSDGQTALHFITFYPDFEITETLLKNSTDVNLRDKYGNNALWYAVFNCKGKSYDLVRLFMRYDVDISTKNKAGRSPLDFAIQIGDQQLQNLLINRI